MYGQLGSATPPFPPIKVGLGVRNCNPSSSSPPMKVSPGGAAAGNFRREIEPNIMISRRVAGFEA